MTKVVYNNCFGGFGLSSEAVRLGREISGDETWGLSVHGDFTRHGEVLVEVVTRLGQKASGEFSNLAIAEVDGPYRIDEYDGKESVETPASYDWITP